MGICVLLGLEVMGRDGGRGLSCTSLGLGKAMLARSCHVHAGLTGLQS